MNFFLCNKCKKRSEDNIINLFEISHNNKKTNYLNIDDTIINQIDTSEKFRPSDYIKKDDENINMNIKDLEEADDDDDLKIIEYPYKKIEQKNKLNICSKLKPKEFKNNESKFNEYYSMENNIINKLNYVNKTKNSNINNQANSNNIKNKIIEKKDTIIDPSNLALSSLIFDINRANTNKRNSLNKKNQNKNINSMKNLNYITSKNTKLKNENKTSYQIKENKIINFIKNSNKQNKNNKKPKKIKCKEYSHSIIRKKKILNNSLASNKNLYINSLNISNLIIKSKKNFEKSLSLNYLENGKPKLNKFKKEKNNTAAEFNIRPKNNKNVKTFSFTPKNNSKIK